MTGTAKVLEAVLDRVDLYDHKGSVDHGYRIRRPVAHSGLPQGAVRRPGGF